MKTLKNLVLKTLAYGWLFFALVVVAVPLSFVCLAAIAFIWVTTEALGVVRPELRKKEAPSHFWDHCNLGYGMKR